MSTAVGRSRVALPRLRAGWLQSYGVYVALIAIVVVNLFISTNFVTLGNLRLQLVQAVPVLIVALGMALVIGTEGIDLSVGSVMAISAALLPLYLGYGLVPALVVSLAAGVATGLLGGWLVSVVGVQPIVATLAILVGGRGLATVIGGTQKSIRDTTLLDIGSNDAFGIPITVLIAFVLIGIVAFMVQRTTFGRQVVAVGGNRVASELAGLPVRRVLLWVYVISGVLAALAGILATARLTASTPNSIGLNIELSAITAVVVGGTPLTGGRVRVVGTVAGALVMQLLISTLISQNLPDSVAQMVQAGIIVVAVYVQRRRRS